MTRDDIIRMAVKCRLISAGNRDGLYMDALAEFAELVAAEEREACAKAAEQIEREIFDAVGDPRVSKFNSKIACVIRARGKYDTR